METFNGEYGGGSMCWLGVIVIFPYAVDFWALSRREKNTCNKGRRKVMTGPHKLCVGLVGWVSSSDFRVSKADPRALEE